MDNVGFDGLARRRSRRAALKGGSTTIAAAVSVALGRAAGAQDASPAAGATPTDGAFLFVQTAASGTFTSNPGAGTPAADGTPVPGGGARYLLTLEGHSGGTVYFSDRPERVFGDAPTNRFLDGLGFSPANPPNAALVAQTDAGQDTLVVELLDPAYDESAGTLTYGANVLGGYDGAMLAHATAQQQDDAFAASFTHASLFIDDCPDISICYFTATIPMGSVPGGPIHTCWSWHTFSCLPCDGTSLKSLNALCNSTWAGCHDVCTVIPG